MPERPGTPLKICALKINSEFLGDYVCTTFVALAVAKNVENTMFFTSKTRKTKTIKGARGRPRVPGGPALQDYARKISNQSKCGTPRASARGAPAAF